MIGPVLVDPARDAIELLAGEQRALLVATADGTPAAIGRRRAIG